MRPVLPKPQRCAIYTRKSTEHNLDLAFNSLDAQREACEAYIKSQAHEGWRLIAGRFDDGGLSGASLERPALQSLLDQVRARKIDIIVVYKVDRLTRSLADFAKLVELFDEYGVSFCQTKSSRSASVSFGLVGTRWRNTPNWCRSKTISASSCASVLNGETRTWRNRIRNPIMEAQRTSTRPSCQFGWSFR